MTGSGMQKRGTDRIGLDSKVEATGYSADVFFVALELRMRSILSAVDHTELGLLRNRDDTCRIAN